MSAVVARLSTNRTTLISCTCPLDNYSWSPFFRGFAFIGEGLKLPFEEFPYGFVQLSTFIFRWNRLCNSGQYYYLVVTVSHRSTQWQSLDLHRRQLGDYRRPLESAFPCQIYLFSLGHVLICRLGYLVPRSAVLPTRGESLAHFQQWRWREEVLVHQDIEISRLQPSLSKGIVRASQ